MKLRLKEDPKEWRKAALLGTLGLGGLSGVLCWRRVLPVAGLGGALAVLAGGALCAWLRPRWFRGYYRLTSRIGFYLTQFVGRATLAVVFLLILTPFGLVLRLMGKDPLRLKRPAAETYWNEARESSPLDRLF